MTHPLVLEVRSALENAANPAKAPQMQAYMKSVMPYRGVSAPAQKTIWKTVFARHPLSSPDEWQRVVLALWRGATFREERYGAIALTNFRPYESYRTMTAVPMIEEMIVTGAWWDYVDVLAGRSLGAVLRVAPERMSRLMRRWARDEDMWKRRSAILCQLGFKRDTDLELLYDCIEPNLDRGGSARATRSSRMAREFFIRKAIGWALRQYAWTDPREVKRYVKANKARLSNLSVREALKNVG
jgi:3-methyladenine DNA glycosylase AlkD